MKSLPVSKLLLMTNILLMSLLLMVFFTKPTQGAEKQEIVMSLKNATNDLYATFTALNIAFNLQKRGANVTLFLSLEGVRLADKTQPLDLKFGHFPDSLETFYKNFVGAGGKVLLCPPCGKVAGVPAENLAEGAKIGTADEIMEMFFKADKVIDY